MANVPSEPTTPVRIPKAVSNYTASTLDPEIRSNVNARLLADGYIPKIHDTLLHALHASPTNWPMLIQTHALALLRNGECTTFHEVLERVLKDIHADTIAQRQEFSATSTSTKNHSHASDANGKSTNTKKTKPGENVGRGERGESLAVPSNVVEEGLRITRQCLECVCEVID